jgi:TRAP transporter TAXI family solute receptor
VDWAAVNGDKGVGVRYVILTFVLCASFAVSARGQPQPAGEVYRANQGTVGVISGMEGGTYAQTAADLTILDDGTLRVLPIIGKGSLQNLSDILYLRGIDVGFVQADALTYAKQHNLFPTLTQSIRYIAKLYDEEIHVLARKDISSLQDLNDQRVNVDVAGSGSAMTAEILLDALGIKPQLEHRKQVDGLEALKQGEIAAIIQVAGAPVPLFTRLGAPSGLHLLPIDLNQTLAQTYLPDQFTHEIYPALVPVEETVPTLAVGDVMAVFAWQPHTERYNKVARFVDAFFSKFDQLLQPPRHPKWREVNLTAEVPGWTRFQPAQDWLTQHTKANMAQDTTQARFATFLSDAKVGNNLSDTAKEELFRQFLSWDKQRQAAH